MSKIDEKLLSFEDVESKNNDLENLNEISEIAERKKWFEENCEYAVLLNTQDNDLLIPIRMNRPAVEKYKKEHPDIVVSTNWFGLYNYLINDNSYRFLCKDWYDHIENTLEYKDKSLPKTIDNLYPIRIFDNIRIKNNLSIVENTVNYINPKTGELLSPDVWFKTGNNFFRGTTTFVEVDIKEYPQFENYDGLINIVEDSVVKTLRLDINGKILPFKNEIKENKIFERLLSFEDKESENNDLENLNKLSNYNYFPKDKDELQELVDKLIVERGENADLNDICTSQITDMSGLFYRSSFNGDISKWNVSNVEDMEGMFEKSAFNNDISKWDVSNVRNMAFMFNHSSFNGDISKWDVHNVEQMQDMFYYSKFNGDISNWDVSNVKSMAYMFYASEFNGDISNWNVSKVKNMSHIFYNSAFNGDISKWNITPRCNIHEANFPIKIVNEKLLSFEDIESEDNDLEYFNDISKIQENKDFLNKKGYVEHDPEYMWSGGLGLFPNYLTIFRQKFGFYVLVDKSRGYKILNDGLIFSFIYPFTSYGITTVKITNNRDPQIYYLDQIRPNPFKYFLNSPVAAGPGYNFIDNSGELLFPDMWFKDCFLDIEWFCRNTYKLYVDPNEDFYLRFQCFSNAQYYIFYPKTKKLIKVEPSDPLLKRQSWRH